MVMTFRIMAGIFAAASGALFRYGHDTLGLLGASFTILALIMALFVNRREPKDEKHQEKGRKLFKAALQVIDHRNYVALESIADFKAVLDENKYFISKKQEKAISCLLSDLHALRIYKEERRSPDANENMKALVSKERELLNRIEAMKPTIEEWLRKLT